MDETVKTQLSDSVRKLSMLSRPVAGVGATDLTPRERGDLIGELQHLAETFDTLAAHATGDDMLDTAREGCARVEATLAELELVQQCVQQPGRTAVRIAAFIGDLSPPIRVRTACQCMGMHGYCQNPVFRSFSLPGS